MFFLLPSPLSPDCMRDTCLPASRPFSPLSAIPPSPCVTAPLLFPTHKDLHRMELRRHSYNYSDNNHRIRTKDPKEEIHCTFFAIFFFCYVFSEEGYIWSEKQKNKNCIKNRKDLRAVIKSCKKSDFSCNAISFSGESCVMANKLNFSSCAFALGQTLIFTFFSNLFTYTYIVFNYRMESVVI